MIGRLHLMYGLSGSGKSTLARSLAEEGAGVRFTLDEWMLRLYPELTIHEVDYGRRAEIVRELIWSLAEQVLCTGADAILDWNSWSLERRKWAVLRANAIGSDIILHRMSTSPEESTRRAMLRRQDDTAYAHPVDRRDNEHLASLLEEPSPEEGLTIVTH